MIVLLQMGPYIPRVDREGPITHDTGAFAWFYCDNSGSEDVSLLLCHFYNHASLMYLLFFQKCGLTPWIPEIVHYLDIDKQEFLYLGVIGNSLNDQVLGTLRDTQDPADNNGISSYDVLTEWEEEIFKKESPLRYVRGVLTYFLLHVIVAALMILFLILFLFGRYVLDVYLPQNRFMWVRCCGRSPTRRTQVVGFVHLGGTMYGYTKYERILSRWFLIAFLAIIFGFSFSAQIDGNLGLTKRLKDFAEPDRGYGQGMVDLLRQNGRPLQELIIQASDQIIVPMLSDLNDIVQTSVNLIEARDASYCVSSSVNIFPDIDLSIQIFQSLDATVEAIHDAADLVLDVLADIELVHNDLDTVGNLLLDEFLMIAPIFDDMAISIINCTDFNAEVIHHQDAMTDGTFGYLTSVISDLTIVETQYPSDLDFLDIAGPTDGSTGGYADLNRFISGDIFAGTPAVKAQELMDLSDKLQALHDQMDVIPNFFDTGIHFHWFNGNASTLLGFDTMTYGDWSTYLTPESMNARPQWMAEGIGALQRIYDELAILQGHYDSLPDWPILLNHITELDGYTGILDFQPLAASLTHVKGTMDNLPAWSVVHDQMERNEAFYDASFCYRVLTREIRNVDADLFKAPPQLDDALLYFESIVDGLESVLTPVPDLRVALLAAEATFVQIDFSLMAEHAYNASQSLQLGKTTLDGPALVSKLADLKLLIEDPFATYFTQLQNLRTLFEANLIPLTRIQEFVDFQVELTDFRKHIALGAWEYMHLSEGYCANIPYLFCTKDSDCATGVCAGIGTKRCANSHGHYQDHVCNVDEDCADMDSHTPICLGDQHRALFLRDLLWTAKDIPPAVTATLQGLEDVHDAYSAALVKETTDHLADTQDSLAEFDMHENARVLERLLDALANFPLLDIRDDMLAAQDRAADMPMTAFLNDYSTFMPAIKTAFESTYIDISKGIAALFIAMEDLFNNLYPSILTQLSQHNLDLLSLVAGVAGTLGEIAGVFDFMLLKIQADKRIIEVPGFSFREAVEQFAEPLDKIESFGTHADSLDHGYFHYLANIFIPQYIISPKSANAMSIFFGADNQRYPNNRVCLSSSCIEHTMKAINTDNLGKMQTQIPFMPEFPSFINLLSRELVFLIPLFFPFFTVFLGIISLLTPYCCKTSRWQKVPASWMTGFVMCQIPFIFVITAIIFPIAITTIDVCHTSPNVLYNFVLTADSNICGLMSMDGNSMHNCEYTVRQELNRGIPLELMFPLDVPGSLKNVFGSCPIPYSAEDAIGQSIENIASQVETAPSAAFLDILEHPDGITDSIFLRPSLVTLFSGAFDDAGYAVSGYLRDLWSDGSLQCEHVQKAVDDAKDLVSCTTIAPLFWYVSCWVLMGWSMLICGIPAGLLARKRIPEKPWGASLLDYLRTVEYNDAKTRALNRELMRRDLEMRNKAAKAFDKDKMPAKGEEGGMGPEDLHIVVPHFERDKWHQGPYISRAALDRELSQNPNNVSAHSETGTEDGERLTGMQNPQLLNDSFGEGEHGLASGPSDSVRINFSPQSSRTLTDSEPVPLTPRRGSMAGSAPGSAQGTRKLPNAEAVYLNTMQNASTDPVAQAQVLSALHGDDLEQSAEEMDVTDGPKIAPEGGAGDEAVRAGYPYGKAKELDRTKAIEVKARAPVVSFQQDQPIPGRIAETDPAPETLSSESDRPANDLSSPTNLNTRNKEPLFERTARQSPPTTSALTGTLDTTMNPTAVTASSSSSSQADPAPGSVGTAFPSAPVASSQSSKRSEMPKRGDQSIVPDAENATHRPSLVPSTPVHSHPFAAFDLPSDGSVQQATPNHPQFIQSPFKTNADTPADLLEDDSTED